MRRRTFGAWPVAIPEWRWTIAVKKKKRTPAEEAHDFAVAVAALAADTRCRNVVILDVTGLSPVCDFIVLATGTSPRQMKSVCDQVEEFAATQAIRPIGSSIEGNSGWALIDFVDVVVHVFSQDARDFYDLDNLWGDAKPVAWDPSAPPVKASATLP